MARVAYKTVIVGLMISLAVALALSCLLILFQRGQNQRNQITCQSNLRQIGQALQMYVADNDGAWPGQTLWRHQQIPALPHSGCPAAEAVPHLEPPLPDVNRGLPGYAFNGNIVGKPILQNGLLQGTALQFNQLVHPETTIAVCDYTNGLTVISTLYCYTASGSEWPYQLKRGWQRHGGKGNYLFCDGHVKQLAEKDIIPTKGDICHGSKYKSSFCVN